MDSVQSVSDIRRWIQFGVNDIRRETDVTHSELSPWRSSFHIKWRSINFMHRAG